MGLVTKSNSKKNTENFIKSGLKVSKVMKENEQLPHTLIFQSRDISATKHGKPLIFQT